MYGQEREIGREVVGILNTYYVLRMELTLYQNLGLLKTQCPGRDVRTCIGPSSVVIMKYRSLDKLFLKYLFQPTFGSQSSFARLSLTTSYHSGSHHGRDTWGKESSHGKTVTKLPYILTSLHGGKKKERKTLRHLQKCPNPFWGHDLMTSY